MACRLAILRLTFVWLLIQPPSGGFAQETAPTAAPTTEQETAPTTARETVREKETAAFNAITSALTDKRIAYEERDLLAGYGAFGKSLFTGDFAAEEVPFLFAFPVTGCRTELALALIGGIDPAADDGPYPDPPPTGGGVVFLGDAQAGGGQSTEPAERAAFSDLFDSLDHPENAMLMYLAEDEGRLTVDFFQGAVKNPFHLTGTFARYLDARAIPFTFRHKTILLETSAHSGADLWAALFLDFAKTRPAPSPDPAAHYIIADFHGKKRIFDHSLIIKTLTAAFAALLLLNLALSLGGGRKSLFFTVPPALAIFAAAALLVNPPRSPQDAPPAGNVPQTPPYTLKTGENRLPETGTITLDVQKTALLDRHLYRIKAAFPGEAFHIGLAYEGAPEEARDAPPAEVYEAPFPYEVDGDRITFTTGEYPPNPFEAALSFPRAAPGLLRITAVYEGRAYVWTEE